MFYRILAIAMLLLGIAHIGYAFLDFADQDVKLLQELGRGIAIIFMAVLNYSYLYEENTNNIPKAVMLGSNVLFIGYVILSITLGVDVIPSYIAAALSLCSSILVLNHKV